MHMNNSLCRGEQTVNGQSQEAANLYKPVCYNSFKDLNISCHQVYLYLKMSGLFNLLPEMMRTRSRSQRPTPTRTTKFSEGDVILKPTRSLSFTSNQKHKHSVSTVSENGKAAVSKRPDNELENVSRKKMIEVGVPNAQRTEIAELERRLVDGAYIPNLASDMLTNSM